MSTQPVIFLAFANSSTDPLARLSEEDDALYKILHDRSVKEGHFHVHRESHTDLNNLRHFLSEYKNQIRIFHYAGHAGSEQLFLSDGEANAGGLAEMLAEQENLQLVFLNGCSSVGQVAHLLELGVPAVIATQVPIGDNMAKDFAKHFYHALEMGANIKDAYGQASAFAKAAGRKTQSYRAMDWRKKEDREASDEIWSLFHHPDKAEILESKLPGAVRQVIDKDFVPNEELISSLWETLVEEGIAMEGRKMKLSRKRMAILNNFPAPIAENLRKLLVPLGDEGEGYDQVGLPRIKQLSKTYQVLLELLTFTLLAQLWEAKSKNPDLKLPKETLDNTRAFLHLKEAGHNSYRFIPLIRQLRTLLDEHQVSYFVEELSDLAELMEEDTDFRKACMYFDLLRERITADSLSPDEYHEQCKRAEASLADLFSELGYLAHYTLATIKHIDVQKYRHTPEASFKHVVVRLVDLLGGMEEEDETLSHFMDNRSVLLLKEDEEEEIVGFLNLSPFIIDENAFVAKSDKSKIFFLNHMEGQGASWCYEYVNNPDDPVLKVPGESFQIIMDQLQAFDKTFLTV